MRLCTLIVAGSTLVVALAGARLSASCIETSFEHQISFATLIFAGTLVEAKPTRFPNTIATRYRFVDVRYAKGSGPADSLILIQDGGCLDGTCIGTSLQIDFNLGIRYVVFADSGNWGRLTDYSPMACALGPFVLRRGPDRGFVMESVASFDSQHMVIVSAMPWEPRFGAWTNGMPPTPPPRLTLQEAIQVSDAEEEARLRRHSSDQAVAHRGRRMRTVKLSPHQDPNIRVSEHEFLSTILRFVERVSANPDSFSN